MSGVDASGPCELLPWDTKFFGVEIARVTTDKLTAERCTAIDEWSASECIDCLYFLARPDDALTVKLAEERGYHLVDLRLTFQLANLSSAATPAISAISLFQPADLPDLLRIARASHTDTRFFYDDRFDRDRSVALYEEWIRSSCAGYAQAVLVSHDGDRPSGYVTCHLDGSGEGRIGLVAVDEAHQGKGVGRNLVEAAKAWFLSQAVQRISVVTQGRNLSAQRLYIRSGFVPGKLELYYHRWSRV